MLMRVGTFRKAEILLNAIVVQFVSSFCHHPYQAESTRKYPPVKGSGYVGT